jgi:hypothetical protein
MRKNRRSRAADESTAEAGMQTKSSLLRTGPAIVGAAGIGAALMYFMDPDRGRRRRALARDKIVHSGKVAEERIGKASRDISNRVRGAKASVRSRVSRGDTDDQVLIERVRSELGRATSHPGAITVDAVDGTIVLHGDVLTEEADALIAAIGKVPGVHDVNDQLARHESSEGVSALQGGGRGRGHGPTVARRQKSWTPARIITAAAGTTLAFFALRQRTPSRQMRDVNPSRRRKTPMDTGAPPKDAGQAGAHNDTDMSSEQSGYTNPATDVNERVQ